MLALSELLVEAPEDLHDAEGGRADGVGEVAARGGYRANDGDGADALGVAEDLALATVQGGRCGEMWGDLGGDKE